MLGILTLKNSQQHQPQFGLCFLEGLGLGRTYRVSNLFLSVSGVLNQEFRATYLEGMFSSYGMSRKVFFREHEDRGKSEAVGEKVPHVIEQFFVIQQFGQERRDQLWQFELLHKSMTSLEFYVYKVIIGTTYNLMFSCSLSASFGNSFLF